MIASLKYRDTQPVLEVTLLKPDLTAYDPTGSLAIKIHVTLIDPLNAFAIVTFTRDLTISDGPSGKVQYAWVATDWSAASPTVNLAIGCWRMEYEVQPSAGARITFPNSGHDWLMVTRDVGQAV